VRVKSLEGASVGERVDTYQPESRRRSAKVLAQRLETPVHVGTSRDLSRPLWRIKRGGVEHRARGKGAEVTNGGPFRA